MDELRIANIRGLELQRIKSNNDVSTQLLDQHKIDSFLLDDSKDFLTPRSRKEILGNENKKSRKSVDD